MNEEGIETLYHQHLPHLVRIVEKSTAWKDRRFSHELSVPVDILRPQSPFSTGHGVPLSSDHYPNEFVPAHKHSVTPSSSIALIIADQNLGDNCMSNIWR